MDTEIENGSDPRSVGKTKSAVASHAMAWLLLGLALFATGLAFSDSLSTMVRSWSSDEYSHGYFIPLITLFILWQGRNSIAANGLYGAWAGVALVVVALLIGVMGTLGTIYIVVQYAFLLTVVGLALAFIGWRGMKAAWIPLLYLGFMIPLPQFLYQRLSSELQLISSELGVAIIRLFGISVFLDGNIIDLGSYKLQVVEACSGLRYLFPLLSFGFLVAFLYRGALWQRAVILLSTIPITIFMNSLRIGLIGVMVDRYGIAMADGFLHFFEGWVIFMTCVAFLFAEVWLFTRFRRRGEKFFDMLRLGLDEPVPQLGAALWTRAKVSGPLLGATAVVLLALTATLAMPDRVQALLERESLATFPDDLADWQGRDQSLERPILESLSLSDYVLADYRRKTDAASVNFYVAYYDSQTSGRAIHSPRSCMPGGGWQITGLSRHEVIGPNADTPPLTVNRTVISKSEDRQLVYYWFAQRDRTLTNEYAVKWYIFWDALTRNRTDGALIRVVTPVLKNEEIDAADARLTNFLSAVLPSLERHLPTG